MPGAASPASISSDGPGLRGSLPSFQPILTIPPSEATSPMGPLFAFIFI